MRSIQVQDKSSATGPADEAGPSTRPVSDQPRIDWTGRSALPGSGGDGGSDIGADGSEGHGTRRLAVLAGVVSVAYIAWVVADLAVLAISGTAYTSMHRTLGSLGPRLVLCVAWLALLYHGLDGLRVVLGDFVPRVRAHDRSWRAAVAFAVFVTWIPTSLIILWPAVRRWFA